MFRTPNPRNPYHELHRELDDDVDRLPARLVVRDDASRSILTENDSPDLGFRWSLNPYRGCTHACAYCYARRTHEHLDHGAGEDFERLVYVKRDAPRLLAEALGRRSWRGEPIMMSGVTDAWQPLEARLGVTRACLEVLVAHRNPVVIVTRSPGVVRDLDLLVRLAEVDAVRVSVSVPVVDETTRAALEPGTAPVAARLRAVRALADAGVPVGVSLAPVLPGLTDHLIPRAVELAAEAGARWAWATMLRLPGNVAEVFEARLRHALPLRADAVLDRIRRLRGGALSSSTFGERFRGEGPGWALVERSLELARRRHGLDATPSAPSSWAFAVPGPQLDLFRAGAGR